MTSSRAGAALLIVLVALVVTLAALGGAAGVLHTARVEVAAVEASDQLLRLRTDGERLAAVWLTQHASQVVLPPEGGGIVLAHDRWSLSVGDGGLSVVVYDALAGVPASLAAPGEALHLALPAHLVTVAIPAVEAGEPPVDLVERTPLRFDQRRYPQPPTGLPRAWRAPGAASDVQIGPTPDARPSLAEAVALTSVPAINLNTAPSELVTAAFHFLERGGADDVIRNREHAVAASEEIVTPTLRLVIASDSWNALVTADWQGRRRSWWIAIAGTHGVFRIVARHVADG